MGGSININSRTNATIGPAVSALLGALGVLLLAVSLAGCEPLDSSTSDPRDRDRQDAKPSFGNRTVPTQSYVAGVAIAPLDLPAATGGDGTLTYSLTSVPAGLSFDAGTRILSGVPASPGSHTLKYRVADRDGDADELSFRVEAEPLTTVYWIDWEGVHSTAVDGTKKQDVLTSDDPIIAMALDRRSSKPGLYYADGTMIRRHKLDGSATEIIVDTKQFVTAITVDSTNGRVYWVENQYDEDSDSTTSKVRRVDLGGSSVEDIMDIENSVYGLAVDSGNSKLYGTSFSSEFTSSKVWRANLDGTSREDIISEGEAAILGIALDLSNQRMYWTEFRAESFTDLSGKVRRATLRGNDAEDLATGRAAIDISLDLANQKMYWTEWNSFAEPGTVRRAELDGSGAQAVLVGESPSFIAVDSTNNGSGSLYWTTQPVSGIRRANLDGSGPEDLIAKKIRSFSSGPLALDMTGRRIYWVTTRVTTDASTCRPNFAIMETALDGSKERVVIENLDSPTHLEFDVVARKLYWYENIYEYEEEYEEETRTFVCSSSEREGVIRRADLDGGGIQELVRLSRTSRASQIIELDPVERKLYWTERNDSDSAVAIRRSNLDGTDPETFVDDLDQPPYGIAIDTVGRKLYWNVWDGNVFHVDLDDPVQERVENAIAGMQRLHAVDGSTGKMYYIIDSQQSQDGHAVAIGQANLDGSGARIIEDDVDTSGQLVLGVAPPASANGSDSQYRNVIRRTWLF